MEILTLIVKKKKILVIIIDKALLFDSHIKDEYKKANQKLTSLFRFQNYLKLKKRKKNYFQFHDKIKVYMLPFNMRCVA